MFQQLKHGEKLTTNCKRSRKSNFRLHKEIDERIETNQFRVLKSFQKQE